VAKRFTEVIIIISQLKGILNNKVKYDFNFNANNQKINYECTLVLYF